MASFNRDRGKDSTDSARRGAEEAAKTKRGIPRPHAYSTQREHYDFAIRKLRVNRAAVEDLQDALRGWNGLIGAEE
jgi:hypothetical protein